MVDDETRALLDALPGVAAGVPPDPGASPAEMARRQARAIFLAFAGDTPSDAACAVEHLSLPGPLEARLYRPASAPRTGGSGALFLHGGGWSVGDLEGYDPLVRSLAVESGLTMLAPEYRLAPEHPFPAALDDSLAALDWLVAHASRLGLDAGRLAVVGDSAGGALAAVVARERAADLAAQVLIYPMTDVASPHDAHPSRGLYGGGDLFLVREAIDAAGTGYVGAGDPANPRISPLFAAGLCGAPPAFVLTAGLDPLRDEGQAYAERLRAGGVDTEHLCLEGAIHAALSFGVLAVGRRGRTAVAAALRARLHSARDFVAREG